MSFLSSSAIPRYQRCLELSTNELAFIFPTVTARRKIHLDENLNKVSSSDKMDRIVSRSATNVPLLLRDPLLFRCDYSIFSFFFFFQLSTTAYELLIRSVSSKYQGCIISIKDLYCRETTNERGVHPSHDLSRCPFEAKEDSSNSSSISYRGR